MGGIGDGLWSGGSRLVESLSEPDDPYSLTALIEEAGRMKDRLDQLDLVLSGEVSTWLAVIDSRSGEQCEVVIDKALAESRQLATVFRQTLVEIQRRRNDGGGGDAGDDLAGL